MIANQFYTDLLKLLLVFLVTCIILLLVNTLKSQREQIIPIITVPDSLLIYERIQADTLFESQQLINILKVNKNNSTHFQFDLAHHSTTLTLTSQFAEKENALAAINGGFF